MALASVFPPFQGDASFSDLERKITNFFLHKHYHITLLNINPQFFLLFIAIFSSFILHSSSLYLACIQLVSSLFASTMQARCKLDALWMTATSRLALGLGTSPKSVIFLRKRNPYHFTIYEYQAEGRCKILIIGRRPLFF